MCYPQVRQWIQNSWSLKSAHDIHLHGLLVRVGAVLGLLNLCGSLVVGVWRRWDILALREVLNPVRNDLMTKGHARFLKCSSDFLVISDMVKVAWSSHSQRPWWGYRCMCTIIVSHYLIPVHLQDVIRVLVRREYPDIINLIWTATIGSQWLLYKCLTLGKPLFFWSPNNTVMNTGSGYRQKD